MLLIGVDVGGTRVKLGIIRDNEIIKKISLPTNAFDIVRQIVNGVRELIQSIGLSVGDVDGIGLGFPGLVVNSRIVDSANIGLKDFDLKEYLQEEFGVPVIVKNDAEMATLAEHKFGAGEDCDNMVLVTLGTGVGGGIIVNDNLYTGAGGAGEFGHMLFEKNGRQCTCGRQGCAEQYVSLSALDRLAKELMNKYPNNIIYQDSNGHVGVVQLMRAFMKNDPCAIEIVSKFLQDLSSFLMDLCHIFRPNKIIVGGGIADEPELVKKADKILKTMTYGFQNAPKVEVVPAKLGNDAGILGAAVCFEKFEFERFESKENFEDDKTLGDTSLVENLFSTQVAETKEDIKDNIENIGQQEETQTNVLEVKENVLESEPLLEDDVQEVQAELEDSTDGVQNEEDYLTESEEGYSYGETIASDEDVYDEFANYKPLRSVFEENSEEKNNESDLTSESNAETSTDNSETAEPIENKYDVFELGQERIKTDDGDSDKQNIINSMDNIESFIDDSSLLEAEEGVVEDLENIEYTPELMARVNKLLKRK